jgi:predicted  nucleic acid-binding Zn-ribbon protein
MKNTIESQSSRLELAENRISRFKDKIDITEKTKEPLDKRLKSCERNMQELSYSIKRPSMQIMGIKKGEEVQTKDMCSMLNKMIAESFPNLKKEMPI